MLITRHSSPATSSVATAALVICVVGMIICRWFEPSLPGLAWPRAFFEAATVGALADWFAVVALFRHPLGIPIPHTAILPNNKLRVAESLASFLETSFLTPAQLEPRFRSIDYAALLRHWLIDHAPGLAERAAHFAPQILSGLDDAAMTTLLRDRAAQLLRNAPVAPLAAEGLEILAQNGRDREIFAAVLRSTHDLIDEHRGAIQSRIRREIPLSADLLRAVPFLKELAGPLLEQTCDNLAAAVANKTIEKIQSALEEATTDPANPLWLSFDLRLRTFIRDLKSSPDLATKTLALQDSLASSDVLADFAARSWSEIKTFILRDTAAENSALRLRLADAIRSAANQLTENPENHARANALLGDQVLAALLAARPHARELVTATITAWDSREMADKLEATVGRDLQFIRLNGTLVGGLIGLLLHATFTLLGR